MTCLVRPSRCLAKSGLIVAVSFALIIASFPGSFFGDHALAYVLPRVEIQPAMNCHSIGEYFTITVRVVNASTIYGGGLYGFDLQITWNPDIVRYTSHEIHMPVETYPDGVLHQGILLSKNQVDETASMPGSEPGTRYWLVASSVYPAPDFPGSGIVFNMTFQVIASGSCLLEILFCQLSDMAGDPMEHEVVNAFFSEGNSRIRDVAVEEVTPLQSFVERGSTAQVDVKVRNQGNATAEETFLVTLYANDTVIGEQTAADLPPNGSQLLRYDWNTSNFLIGPYRVKAVAETLIGESDSSDNVLVDGVVTVTVADALEVQSIALSKNSVTPGETVQIQVTVRNLLSYSYTCRLKVYADADTSQIGDELTVSTQTFTIGALATSTSFCTWYVADTAPGNLTVSAEALPMPGEINVSNNLLVDGVVFVLPYVPDTAIIDIRTLDNTVYSGAIMRVYVDTQNQASLAATVNITLYADKNLTTYHDEMVIGSKTLALSRYGSLTATFYWNTSGLTGNHTLSAAIVSLPNEVDIADNSFIGKSVILLCSEACPGTVVFCPSALTVNPSIFTYDSQLRARLINIGNVSIESTGFEGDLRAVGSNNGTIQLRVNEPTTEVHEFYLPAYGEVQVPLWLVFQPETHWETYNGNFTLTLTVGTYRRTLLVKGISIRVCVNGAYVVYGQTVTFSWNLTGGSLVYLTAEPDLPEGWTYTVDPPLGTLFDTPRVVKVNITAPPDAKEGEMGRVTLRAYKNETGAMIWQFIFFASTDNKPPTIEEIYTPILTPDGHAKFSARVNDPAGVSQVLLFYSTDGMNWYNDTLQWTSGDTFNSTIYTIEKAFDPLLQSLQYYISATDWLFNTTQTSVQTLSLLRDTTITNVVVTEVHCLEDYRVFVNVTARNCAELPLSFFSVALYANSTLMSTWMVTDLAGGESRTVSFNLTLTQGNYVITALAAAMPGESNTLNNAQHAQYVLHLIRDVAARSIIASKTILGPYEILTLNVTVYNQGRFDEALNVTACLDTITLGFQIANLVPGEHTTLSFTLDTSGYSKKAYALSAVVQRVPAEVSLQDNTCLNGTVVVTLRGDVDGNFNVNILDVVKITSRYGETMASSWPKPPIDINNDGKITILDVVLCTTHYGEKYP